MNDDKRKAQLEETIEDNSSEWIEKIPAVLGNTAGEVDAGGALVYCRIGPGIPVIAVNYIAPLRFDTQILIGRSKSQPGYFQVISVRQTFPEPISNSVKNHHEQHEEFGEDRTNIGRRQIIPRSLWVRDAAAFTVQFYPDICQTQTGIKDITTGNFDETIDVSSYIPTEGAKYITIVCDSDGLVTVVDGTAVDAIQFLTTADIPTPSSGSTYLGHILLYEAQAELSNQNIHVAMPLGGGDSAFPTGIAGGDLSGTYPNPTVAKIGGIAVTVDTDGTLTANSDAKLATQKATKTYTDAAKASAISTAETYANGLVIGLWDDRGSFDASGGAYPSSGGSGTAGAILKGDIWTISVAGTLPTGQVVEIGDVVRALIDAPGNTQANWVITQNNIGYVAENSANKTSTITGNETSTVLYSTIKGIVDWLKEGVTSVLSSKTTPIDADGVIINDSADGNKTKLTTWANIKITLKAAIKLDEWSAPTDVTTLDASTSAHGLLIKATAPVSGVRNILAIDNGETVYKNTALIDSTNPADIGTAAPGTSLIAARRDHVHGGSYLSLSNRPTIETNANDIFRCDSPGGVSAFAGTIATLPGGATLTYNVTSGQELAMVPFSTSQLGKMLLHNTTRGTHALISNCVAGTNTITLTANVPVGWAVTDVITIASQTVSGGGRSWVDIEITSGLTGKTNVFVNLTINSATAGDNFWYHPFSVSYSDSKVKPVVAQATSRTLTVSFPVSVISNTFALSWSGTPAVCIVREDGYLE